MFKERNTIYEKVLNVYSKSGIGGLVLGVSAVL